MAEIIPIDPDSIPTIKRKGKTVPTWMTDLIEQVCINAGKPMPARIGYQRSKYPDYYSGRTWWHDGGRIHVRIGDDVAPSLKRMIVLHELAHHLVGPDQHHNEWFWTVAFTHYYRYDVDIEMALEKETEYRKSAARGYANATRMLGRGTT